MYDCPAVKVTQLPVMCLLPWLITNITIVTFLHPESHDHCLEKTECQIQNQLLYILHKTRHGQRLLTEAIVV